MLFIFQRDVVGIISGRTSIMRAVTEWCCMADLTRLSIENGNAPVAVPDFTRGSWNKVKGYRHAFAK